MSASLLDGLFPYYCALCGLRSHRPLPLCIDCERDLPINRCCCTRCAIPLPDTPGHAGLRLCGNCLHTPPPFQRVIAPWLYSEQLAYLIHRWKYRGERQMTPLLAALWLQQARPGAPIDLLVPVPLHWRRLWRRGFNQSELLCRQLRATCPQIKASALARRVVCRQRATAAQSGMNASQRAGNLRGAFTALRPCDNLRIAIVDDVLTTGATAAALARELIAAGATHIEIWCLARTPAPHS